MSVMVRASAAAARTMVVPVARAVPGVPLHLTRSAARRSSRIVRGSAQWGRAFADVLTGSQRQVWKGSEGRAQIEVRLPTTMDDAARVCASVGDALRRVPGVEWATVDPTTCRAVVRFDPDAVGTEELMDTVAAAEHQAVEPVTVPTNGKVAPVATAAQAPLPGFSRPVHEEAVALGVTLTGLAAAAVRRALPLPPLSPVVTAAVVLVDNQPRLRAMLNSKLGTAGTDLALAESTAAAHGVNGGVSSLAVDSAVRLQSWLAERARRQEFTTREEELCGIGRPVPSRPQPALARPAPLPPGPVERFADRAAAGSLVAAGAVGLLTGNVNSAARAVLVGAPKAARAGRQSFTDALTAGLARRGVLVLDRQALEALDRVDAVLIDADVLLTDQPLIIGATALTDSWTSEHVWSVAQRLLARRQGLSVPPPAGRYAEHLELVGGPPAGRGGATEMLLTEHGDTVGTVLVGREIDPYATALLTAARTAGLQVVLTEDVSVEQLAAHADRTVTLGQTSAGAAADGDAIFAAVRTLQADGHVVAVVTSAESAAAAADIGIGVVQPTGRVPWTADILCRTDLRDAARILDAAPVARLASQRGVTLAAGATFVGGLLLAVGARRAGGPTLPVNAAAASALASGHLAARRLLSAADPQPVPQTPWHCLEPDDVRARLSDFRAPDPAVAPTSPDAHLEPQPTRTGRDVPTIGAMTRPLAAAGALARNVGRGACRPAHPSARHRRRRLGGDRLPHRCAAGGRRAGRQRGHQRRAAATRRPRIAAAAGRPAADRPASSLADDTDAGSA